MNLSSHFINHTLNIIKLMFINYYTRDHCSIVRIPLCIVSATGISIMSKQASILSFTKPIAGCKRSREQSDNDPEKGRFSFMQLFAINPWLYIFIRVYDSHSGLSQWSNTRCRFRTWWTRITRWWWWSAAGNWFFWAWGLSIPLTCAHNKRQLLANNCMKENLPYFLDHCQTAPLISCTQQLAL